MWIWGIALGMGLKQTISKTGGLPQTWELNITRETGCSGKSFSEPSLAGALESPVGTGRLLTWPEVNKGAVSS